MRPRWSVLAVLLPLIPSTFAIDPPDPGEYARRRQAGPGTGIATSTATPTATPTAKAAAVTNSSDPLEDGTIFNNQHVPPMLIIPGDVLDKTIKEGYWLVEFFSPYCGHCKEFAPTLQTLYEFHFTSDPLGKTSDLSPEGLNGFTRYYDFNFAKVDCVANGDACLEKDVKSYPTLVLYKDGESVKKSAGTKTLKEASDFVEEILESIKPGSRPKEGVKLPEVGASGVDTNAKPDDPAAKHKDPVAGAAVGEKHNEIAAKATGAESKPVATPRPKKPLRPVNVEGKSVALSAAEFQKRVTLSKGAWLVKFYAPWCHHCQALAPNWAEMAREMQGKLDVGEVNCDVERTLCRNAKVQAYPTIMFFRGGEFIDYNGLRGVGDLIRYAKQAVESGDGVEDVGGADFSELEKNEDVIFVYFYDHATTQEDFAALERLTLALIGKAKLVKTKYESLIDRFKITTFPRLMVSRSGKPSYYAALAPKEMRHHAKVLTWMKSVWLPLVPEMTATNARDITRGRLTVLAVLNRERAVEFERAKREMKAAAKEWIDEAETSLQQARQQARQKPRAKGVRIEEETLRRGRKEVQFAWIDGVFWERWVRHTYGVVVKRDGERVVVVDEERKIYYPRNVEGKEVVPDSAAVMGLLRDVVEMPKSLGASSTRWWLGGFVFSLWHYWNVRPVLSVVVLAAVVLVTLYMRRSRRASWKKSLGGLNGVAGEVEKGLGGLVWGAGNRNSGGLVGGKVD